MNESLYCFYRISDNAQKSSAGDAFNKIRPDWFDKKQCFSNFIRVFGTENLFVIADCIGPDTAAFLESHLPPQRISRTDYKSGAFSFLHAARLASGLPDETKIYMVEDDYVHTDDSRLCLIEALDISDYATAYDHPDKYVDANTINRTKCVGNPLISENSESTRLYLTKSCHHKSTNSTTMSFAVKAGTIKQDFDVYQKYCEDGFPRDFHMWMDLTTKRRRRLISTVPAKATHVETAYLSPLVNWEIVLRPFNEKDAGSHITNVKY